jgi:hypothetical protein
MNRGAPKVQTSSPEAAALEGAAVQPFSCSAVQRKNGEALEIRLHRQQRPLSKEQGLLQGGVPFTRMGEEI